MKRSSHEVAEIIGVATAEDKQRWASLLSRVDYKPGWAFTLIDYIAHKGTLAVQIKMLVWDTMESRDLKPLVVVTQYTVPAKLLGKKFTYPEGMNFLLRKIIEIEAHEAREWLRFDGMQCYNPHGEAQLLGRRPEGWEWICPPEIKIAPTLATKESHAPSPRP